MTAIVSGYGLVVQIVASRTFPGGVTITSFADDADPFDLPSLQIADKAMGGNGDLIGWQKPQPIVVSLSVIPNTQSERLLSVLFETNRVGRGKLAVFDLITMTGIYQDGRTITLTNGFLTDGMPGLSVSSAGRLKTKTFSFAFENEANT